MSLNEARGYLSLCFSCFFSQIGRYVGNGDLYTVDTSLDQSILFRSNCVRKMERNGRLGCNGFLTYPPFGELALQASDSERTISQKEEKLLKTRAGQPQRHISIGDSTVPRGI